MKCGNYHIGQNVSEVENELVEISGTEHSVLKRSFKDKKIYHKLEDYHWCNMW